MTFLLENDTARNIQQLLWFYSLVKKTIYGVPVNVHSHNGYFDYIFYVNIQTLTEGLLYLLNDGVLPFLLVVQPGLSS